jgi:hypothetical protein
MKNAMEMKLCLGKETQDISHTFYYERLVISACFLVIDIMMLFAKSGRASRRSWSLIVWLLGQRGQFLLI